MSGSDDPKHEHDAAEAKAAPGAPSPAGAAPGSSAGSSEGGGEVLAPERPAPPDKAGGEPPKAPPPVAGDDDDFPDDDGPDSGQLRDLLRKAGAMPVPPPKVDLLRGVQRQIRVRSKGKFYADGWSTREDNPRGTYLVTAAVMLVLVAIVYLALIPGGIGHTP